MKWGEDDCGHHPEWCDDQDKCHHPACIGERTTGREDRGSHTEADAAAYERAHTERLSPLELAIENGYDPEDDR